MPVTNVRSKWSGGNLIFEKLDGSAVFGIPAVAGSTTKAAATLAVPITHRAVVMTTGVGAEALTLANGAPGQILTLILGTDGGGDGTLTPATKTGFATIVFADAGDNATLMYIDDTVGWVLLGTAGIAAPPAIS
jgi:hypothetical protein